MKKLYTTLLLLVLCTAHGRAQNWLDPQFGNGGIADAPIHTSQNGAVALLDSAAGGKLTSFGWYVNGTTHGDAVARYLGNGSLDPSFGVNGVFTLPADTVFSFGSVATMRTQADGKIVIAGTYSAPWSLSDEDFFLVRVLADGSGLDQSFGNAGIVKTDFYGIAYNGDILKDIAFQADGKIVAAGESDSLFKNGVSIIRYKPDGTIDSSFGTNGRVLRPIGTGYSEAKRVFVLPDSKILIAAQASAPGSGITFALLRLLPDGSPDMSFGNAGLSFAMTSAGGYGLLKDAILQQDGKVVLTGGDPIQTGNFLVVRLRADGTPDTSFNHTGTVNFPVPWNNRSMLLSLQVDGKIVVAGDNGNTAHDKWLAARLRPDGTIDSSFGNNGFIESADLGINGRHFLHDIHVQPDGKLVVGGQQYITDLNRVRILARFLPDNANGIPDLEGAGSFKLFPNPADDGVHFTLAPGVRLHSIRIYDAKGSLVSGEINTKANYIVTDYLAEGVYMVEVVTTKHTVVRKRLVVVH